MIRIFTTFFILITTTFPLLAQGFDWQYSARLPTKSPGFFAGLTGEFNYLTNNANIDLRDTKTSCCSFQFGQGVGSAFGLQVEYWSTGVVAYYGNIEYVNNGGTFSKQIETPKRNYVVTYQNNLTSSLSYIMLELGFKYRLFLTHLHVGAGIKLGYRIDSSLTYTESIVSPASETFTDDHSQVKTVTDRNIPALNNFLAMPRIRIGYDLNVGLGMYATPSVNIGYSFTNITKDADWKLWSFSLGLTIYRGFF